MDWLVVEWLVLLLVTPVVITVGSPALRLCRMRLLWIISRRRRAALEAGKAGQADGEGSRIEPY